MNDEAAEEMMLRLAQDDQQLAFRLPCALIPRLNNPSVAHDENGPSAGKKLGPPSSGLGLGAGPRKAELAQRIVLSTRCSGLAILVVLAVRSAVAFRARICDCVGRLEVGSSSEFAGGA